jgi:hypothetical protein
MIFSWALREYFELTSVIRRFYQRGQKPLLIPLEPGPEAHINPNPSLAKARESAPRELFENSQILIGLYPRALPAGN